MISKKTIGDIFQYLFLLFIGVVWYTFGYIHGKNKATKEVYTRAYKAGMEDGFDLGVDKALDTVRAMANRQISYDNKMVSKVIIQDTAVYYFSKKTVRP